MCVCGIGYCVYYIVRLQGFVDFVCWMFGCCFDDIDEVFQFDWCVIVQVEDMVWNFFFGWMCQCVEDIGYDVGDMCEVVLYFFVVEYVDWVVCQYCV